jgi:hypothetical protein
MKTLLVTAFLALATVATAGLGGCSSDNSGALVTNTSGSVPQGGACATTDDCEPNGGLSCAYALNDAGTACPTKGVCVALGPFTVEEVCACGGKVYQEAYVNANYSTVAPGGSCPAQAEGGTTTPTGDAATTTTTDASGGSKTSG